MKGLAQIWLKNELVKLVGLETCDGEYALINIELAVADHFCYKAEETCRRIEGLL